MRKHLLGILICVALVAAAACAIVATAVANEAGEPLQVSEPAAPTEATEPAETEPAAPAESQSSDPVVAVEPEPAEAEPSEAVESEPVEVVATDPDYFTITGTAAFSVEINYHSQWAEQRTGTIQYSTDEGTNWTDWDGSKINAPDSKTLLFRGSNNSKITYYHDWKIATTGTVALKGNIMTLLDWQKVAKGETPSMGENAFCYMFENCTAIASLEGTLLPATTLAEGCYDGMFEGCTGLKELPANLLPATNLVKGCYERMFYGCTGLTSLPANLLPASNLAEECYSIMFEKCTGLKELPETLLPASNLAEECYYGMFDECTGLTSLPANLLPATNLAPGCYSYMFYECYGLTELPTNLLPATNLAKECYKRMFKKCYSLTELPANLLPASSLPESCYAEMFAECSNLMTLPNISHVTSLGKECCQGMFSDCDALEVNDEGSGVTWSTPNVANPGDDWNKNMLSGTKGNIGSAPALNKTYYVASAPDYFTVTGTDDFFMYASKHWDDTVEYSIDGSSWRAWNGSCIEIPASKAVRFRGTGNSVITYNSSEDIYSSWDIYSDGTVALSGNIMTLLDWQKVANGETPAMGESAFSCMFQDCTVITSLSEGLLPATDLAAGCYFSMFDNCTGLSSLPANLLPAINMTEDCYGYMFEDCTGLKELPENLLPATNLAAWCYYYMFYGCTGLEELPENLLPADNLTEKCYDGMFYGCTGLKELSEDLLPATTLAPGCYGYMFCCCTGLKELPEDLLPADNLVEGCYQGMFACCRGLSSLPANLLSATNLAPKCYSYMFSECTGLEKLPANLLPASSLPGSCYKEMFEGCSKLRTLPSISHVTSLGKGCCQSMFSGCGALKVNDEGSGAEWSTPNVANPGADWNNNMLSGTKGNIGSAPALGKTYYVASDLEYFTITGTAAFSIYAYKDWDGTAANALEYSIDEGATWTSWDGSTIAAPASKILLFRGTGNTVITSNGNSWEIETTGTVALSGNIMTLLDWQTVTNGEMPTMGASAFYSMFEDCTAITSLSEGLLPATDLAKGCYSSMFEGCTGLSSIPAKLLPATNLAVSCYSYMFEECASLTELPEDLLSATTLKDYCYEGMFYDCRQLSSLPANLLPATDLAKSCYSTMFNGCEQLSSIPADFLHATNLAESCYSYMFCGCDSLTELSENLLPAKTLKKECYSGMFCYCFNLEALPADLLPAKSLPEECYRSMFAECSKLETLPVISHVTSLGKECCQNMFEACGALEINNEGFGVEWSTPEVESPGEDWNEGMFSRTRSSIGSDPALNTTYYVGNRILEQPSTVNSFTFKLDETGYDQDFKSIQYAWYGFETSACTPSDVTTFDGSPYQDGSWVVTKAKLHQDRGCADIFTINLKAGETLFAEMSAEDLVNPRYQITCYQPGFYSYYRDIASLVFQAPYDGTYKLVVYADDCADYLSISLSVSRRAATASYRGKQLSSSAPQDTPFICVANLLDEGVDSVATDSAEEVVQEIASDVVTYTPSDPKPIIPIPGTGDSAPWVILGSLLICGAVAVIYGLRRRRSRAL